MSLPSLSRALSADFERARETGFGAGVGAGAGAAAPRFGGALGAAGAASPAASVLATGLAGGAAAGRLRPISPGTEPVSDATSGVLELAAGALGANVAADECDVSFDHVPLYRTTTSGRDASRQLASMAAPPSRNAASAVKVEAVATMAATSGRDHWWTRRWRAAIAASAGFLRLPA